MVRGRYITHAQSLMLKGLESWNNSQGPEKRSRDSRQKKREESQKRSRDSRQKKGSSTRDVLFASHKGIEKCDFGVGLYTNPSGDIPTAESYLDDSREKTDPLQNPITLHERCRRKGDLLYMNSKPDSTRLDMGDEEEHAFNQSEISKGNSTRIEKVRDSLRLDELNTEERQHIDKVLRKHFKLFRLPEDLLECTVTF